MSGEQRGAEPLDDYDDVVESGTSHGVSGRLFPTPPQGKRPRESAGGRIERHHSRRLSDVLEDKHRDARADSGGRDRGESRGGVEEIDQVRHARAVLESSSPAGRPQSAQPSRSQSHRQSHRHRSRGSARSGNKMHRSVSVRTSFMNTKRGLLRLAQQMRDSHAQTSALEDEIVMLKDTIQNTRRRMAKTDVDMSDSVGNQEKLHRETLRLSGKTKDIRNSNWIVGCKLKKLQCGVSKLGDQRDQRELEIEQASQEIGLEVAACESLQNLISRMKTQLASLKRERELYQRKATESARTAALYRAKVRQWQSMNAGFQRIFSDMEAISNNDSYA